MEISSDPQTYGLPAKFVEWWDSQKELIEFVLNSQKKFVVLNAPTGVGKTAVAMTLANILNVRTYYVVSSKGLQDQIEKEFGSMGVKVIKGRGNYQCVIEPSLTPEECKFEQLTGNYRSCPAAKVCPYFVQRNEAQKARIVAWNYAGAITSWNYTQGWGRAGLIVADECDEASDWLSNMVKIRFGYHDFAEHGFNFPGESPEEIKTVLAELYLKAADKLAELKKLDVNTASKEEVIALRRCNNLIRRLNFYQTVYEPNWITTRETKRDKRFWHVTFEPIWSRKFGNMLYGHVDEEGKVVFMSATPGAKDEFCFKLGLNPDDVDYIEVPSPFPVENRKIIYRPVGDLSQKYYERNRANMITAIDQIISERLNEKGIIHTPSYALAKDIARLSRYAPYMMLVTEEDNKTEVLQRFKNSDAPRILVSAVHGRGVDLPGDEARYAIIPKVLWPDLGDEKVRRRLEERPSWYPAQAIDSIIQAAGRIVRSVDDYGTTYILDTQFKRLLHNNLELFPMWFLEALFEENGRSTDENVPDP